MLTTKAIFERKISAFDTKMCVIDGIEVMGEKEFEKFSNNLLRDTEFIADRKDEMYIDSSGQTHCLLALDENSGNGILIDSQGYDYARYVAFMPNIKPYIEKQIALVAEQIIKDASENTSNGSWVVSFDEIANQHGIVIRENNGISGMLFDELESREEMADILVDEECFDMNIYLAYCTNLDEESMVIVDADKHTKSLSDMLCCTWEDVHLVHTDEDIEPCTISELSDVTLTESGKEEWADILNAKVQRVFTGLYGLQIELSDVSAHRLEEFSQALAGYCSVENNEKWFASENSEPTQNMKM